LLPELMHLAGRLHPVGGHALPPEERTFSGGTLEDGLIRCLTWLALQSAGTVV